MTDCIFCKIVAGEIPKELEKETANFVVFKDIKPSAPIHLLIVPRKHVADFRSADDGTWLEVKKIATEIATEKSVAGFRLVANVGEAAAVPHMHVHFLGGIKADREI